MNEPDIRTAIPLRRYSLGEFGIVVLGDVDSGNEARYLYVVAVIRQGDDRPGLYITAEKGAAGQGGEDLISLRVIMRDGEEVLGSSMEWSDLDAFATEALTIVSTILDVRDEEPYRLM